MRRSPAISTKRCLPPPRSNSHPCSINRLPLFSPRPLVLKFSVSAITRQTMYLAAVVFLTVRCDEHLGSRRHSRVEKIDSTVYLTDFAAS